MKSLALIAPLVATLVAGNPVTIRDGDPTPKCPMVNVGSHPAVIPAGLGPCETRCCVV